MPAISVDTISGIAGLDNTDHACIQTGGCSVLNGNLFYSYGMEYKKCTDIAWCQYPNPLTCGSLGVGVTSYNVTIPNLDTNTCYQYHAIVCRTYAVSGTTLSIHTPISYPWVTTSLCAGPIPGTTYDFTISSLSANTIYEYRSYMIVCGVEYCGKNSYQIATQPTPTYPPTVCTCAITGIGQTTATGNGLVSSDGGSAVSARGTAWNTAPSPTIADSHTIDGSGTGTFVSSLTGLAENTTYYVRAYATNANGTAYGNEVNFMTLSPPPPPTLSIFLEASTDVLDMVIAGAFCLVCCNGSAYATVIIGSPYACQISKSCLLNSVPAGCYYVDYDGVQLWCCCPHNQVSISGVNWSDNTHPSVFYECCTACFDTNNSVYGCIY